MPRFTLTVNGRPHVVNVAADMPLIYVLANELRLSGTRLGCGIAQCGACAVLADGREIRSCTTPVSQVGSRRITTIEGLPALWAAKKKLSAGQAAKTLHPVQQAWIDVQVPQCGYCQSGMLMAAAALLAKNSNPSDADIDAAMTNLCRCGTYPRVRAAIKQAAKGGTA